MQAALAFQRVEAAFAFCVTSYAKIAEWKAVMDRVSQFEAAMGAVDRAGPARRRDRHRARTAARPGDRRT